MSRYIEATEGSPGAELFVRGGVEGELRHDEVFSMPFIMWDM